MATRTGGRLFLSIVLIAGAFFTVTRTDIGHEIGTFLGGGSESKILGDGDDQIMVSAHVQPVVEKCTVDQVIKNKQCEGVKIVLIDAAKMPFIARNISLA